MPEAGSMQSEARATDPQEATERWGMPMRGRWAVPEGPHPDEQRPETD
ncbi:hypothetical protein [Streptomyces hoynatensis]|nr:hypothetical protein [Streptomyces hoynatensis]